MDKVGRHAVDTLKEGKEIEYGLLGVKPFPETSNRVGEVQINSPAFLGDVLTNDEIIAVDDVPVRDFDSLILTVNAFSAGDTVRLKLRRHNEIIERSITLAKYPVDGEIIATNRPKPWRGLRVDYASVLRARSFGPNLLESASVGVTVTEVEEGSPAALAGVKKGHLIRQVGDTPVSNPRTFYEAAFALEGPVTLITDLGAVTVK
jgi:S1-C subfamily serine protease